MKRERISVGLPPYPDWKPKANGFDIVTYCQLCRQEPTNDSGAYCQHCEDVINRMDKKREKYPKEIIKEMINQLLVAKGKEMM